MASCTNCGKDASAKCAGCLDAPEYTPGDSPDIFYCSRECQVEGWPSHKKDCNNLKQRKSLIRAVNLLKATFLAFREVMFDFHVTKIEPCSRALVVTHDPKRHGQAARFPGHLTSNSEHKEAVLLKLPPSDSLSLLGPMTRTLLADIVSDMGTVVLKVQNQPYPVEWTPPDDLSYIDSLDPCVHHIVTATLKNSGEEWVIDITGRQFGLKDALLPFEKYITHNSCFDIKDPEPYDHTETSLQDKLLSMFPPRWYGSGTTKEIHNEKVYRKHFAAFVREHVESSLLQGSDAEFAAKIDIFAKGVDKHMADCQKQVLHDCAPGKGSFVHTRSSMNGPPGPTRRFQYDTAYESHPLRLARWLKANHGASQIRSMQPLLKEA
ncbi:hypothetical protein ACHAPU_001473 [Fusarium lateritium]